MFRSGRNPCIETTDNPSDAAARECSARAPRARALGRGADGRGAEARCGAAEPATPASRAARRAVARARHAAGTTRNPFASIDAHLFEPSRIARGVPQIRFPRRPLLGPERSRPPRRRGRRAPRVRARGPGARRTLRRGRQPGRRARGRVWSSRFHSHALRTPTEARRGLVYVLLNFRKHLRAYPGVDPRSSGPWFGGWRTPVPASSDAVPVVAPRTWLATVGWRRAGGPIAFDERPASAPASPIRDAGRQRRPARALR